MATPNVLIVEDDPIFALDLQDIVWESGCTPIGPARCLQGALELSHSFPIDIALVDTTLSDGETGLTVARLLSEQFGIRTVIVSGSIPPADAMGDTEFVFVQKPVPAEVLGKILAPLARSGAKRGRAGYRQDAAEASVAAL
ncbi:response regulator [Chthonobacter rhizosphaerae]|uniref:response regulator n=1 Tax=Chthonobacter rhizosphaerae TaxID=2735553 RepID=UPI0015EF7B4F|nr:response regulator [Chthonobacter rhizosphaerae]